MGAFESTIGRWWVSGRPDAHAPGYLEHDPASTGGPWRVTVEGALAELPEPGFDRHLTLHGGTARGQYTLMGALPSRVLGARGEPAAQIWHGWRLVRGGHIDAGEKLRAASFRIPHLWDWIGPGPLNNHITDQKSVSRPTPDAPGEPLSAGLPEKWRITLGRSFTEAAGRASESWDGHGVYALRRDESFTLDEVDGYTLALSRLQSILTATPMEAFEVSLHGEEGGWESRFDVVDAGPPSGADWGNKGLPDPFFDTAEVDFERFVGSWIRLHENATGAMAAAAPRDDRPFVTSKLIEVCNGLEELAALTWERPLASDEDKRVLALLRDGGVAQDVCDYIKFQLRLRQWTLADKLERLARLAGSESAEWLLGQSISEWARIVSRLRNSLAHGKRLPGGLSDDMPFVITAQLSATAVLRLALLRLAGYENPLSKGASGELLRSGGKRVAGHPNSRLFHELETVASYSSHWSVWLDRLGA